MHKSLYKNEQSVRDKTLYSPGQVFVIVLPDNEHLGLQRVMGSCLYGIFSHCSVSLQIGHFMRQRGITCVHLRNRKP